MATFETRAREAGEADGAAGNRGWSVGLAEPPREAGEEEEGAVQSGGPGVPPAMRSSPTMQSRVGTATEPLCPGWGLARRGETLAVKWPKREASPSPTSQPSLKEGTPQV